MIHDYDELVDALEYWVMALLPDLDRAQAIVFTCRCGGGSWSSASAPLAPQTT